MEKSRDYYFDNAKFFLIILVVLGHSMEIVSGEHIRFVYRLIYLFHIPAFVLIAGYFSKSQRNSNLIELISQYIVFQVLYTLVRAYLFKTDVVITFFSPYWILWFLLALVIWKIVTPHFSKLRYPIVFSIVLAILVGYDSSINTEFSLSRIIVFFPFFLCGYYAKKEHFQILKKYCRPIIAVALFIISYFILTKTPDWHFALFFNSVSYQAMDMNYWYAGVIRLIILFWGFIMMCCFFSLIPTSKMFYSKLGTRTMQAFLLHGFIIEFLRYYDINTHITSQLYGVLFYIGIVIITIVLLTKPFEYLFIPFKYISKLLVRKDCR